MRFKNHRVDIDSSWNLCKVTVRRRDVTCERCDRNSSVPFLLFRLVFRVKFDQILAFCKNLTVCKNKSVFALDYKSNLKIFEEWASQFSVFVNSKLIIFSWILDCVRKNIALTLSRELDRPLFIALFFSGFFDFPGEFTVELPFFFAVFEVVAGEAAFGVVFAAEGCFAGQEAGVFAACLDD